LQDIEVIDPDASKVIPVSGMVESKSVGTFSPLQKQDGQRGLFVDRGVGSPRIVKSASASSFTNELKPKSESKVFHRLYFEKKLIIILVMIFFFLTSVSTFYCMDCHSCNLFSLMFLNFRYLTLSLSLVIR